jgi:hypothetical protein
MGAGDNDNPRANVFFIDQSVDADLSEPLFKGHLDILGLRFPATWDAANCTFYESDTEDGTYRLVHWEQDGAFTLTGGVDLTIKFGPERLAGCKWVKIATSAVQLADRTITPIFRNFD